MRIQVKHCGDKNLTAAEVQKFNINPQNREVKPAALQKTIKAIYNPEEHTWEQARAIEVNLVTNNITDGQHRREGFIIKVSDGGIPSDSTIPVHFVKVPAEQELAYIQLINKNKSWTTEDFVKAQIYAGNEDSEKLLEFCESLELCHTVKKNGVAYNFRAAAALLTKGRKETKLREGTFEFPEENRELAITVHNELVEILSIFPTLTKGKANIEAMAKAWYEVRDRYSFNVWKKAIKKNSNGPLSMSLTAANSWRQYFVQCAGTIALGEAK